MYSQKKNEHQFAIFVDSTVIELQKKIKNVKITDKDLHHRLATILRFSVGDQCIFFNQKNNALITFESITKKEIVIKIDQVAINTIYKPPITVLLPLLKKDALETALYGLIEVGVNDIVLVQTQKVQRSFGGTKELERLHNVVIAASEQSKNFVFPTLKLPLSFEQAIAEYQQHTCIFFDPKGTNIFDYVSSLKENKKPLVMLVGPEGDLTDQEKELLQQHNFNFVALTPTVLRAQQAVVFGAGFLRCLNRQ